MIKIIKRTLIAAVSVISPVFIFVSDELILKSKFVEKIDDSIYVLLCKLFFFFLVIGVFFIANITFEKVKWFHIEHDKNYEIEIRYDNILKTNKGMHLINFDECFSVKIGEENGDIKKSSLCGQYLLSKPIRDMRQVVANAGIKSERKKSKFQDKECYRPGTIIVYEGDLLMAFARLDENGHADFTTLAEYLHCLEFMWKQIYVHHGDSNVCIPILGAGRTKIENRNLSQQELLDIMIFSYKTSNFRLKKPNKLYICCKRDSNFSLNKIGKSL